MDNKPYSDYIKEQADSNIGDFSENFRWDGSLEQFEDMFSIIIHLKKKLNELSK